MELEDFLKTNKIKGKDLDKLTDDKLKAEWQITDGENR